MQVSLITDEVSADPETALELGAAWGVRHYELRGVGDRRVPLFTDYQKQHIGELLDEYGAQVVALSPGLFKFPFPPAQREQFPVSVIDATLYSQWRTAHDLLRLHMEEVLPASLAYANELGVELVSVFGFDRAGAAPGLPPDEVLHTLHAAAEQAQRAGVRLCLEAEAGFWGDTGQRTMDLVEAVNHPALGINWDPGNAIVAGDIPFPTGYQAVRAKTWHVHFKDTVRDADGSFRHVITGDVDWRGQIAALKADGYTGYVSVETHMSPKISSAQASVQRLQALLEELSETPSH